jgi:hypothetical protein
MLTGMKQRLPVWPYFALALLSGVIGATLLFYNLGSGAPAEDELQKVSGTIAKVFLIDDLSGEQTTITKPMNSIHFTLEGVEGEFRFPSHTPGYTKIWEQLSFDVEVWVRGSEMANDEPLQVYRLEQQVPEDWIVEPISISYEQISESLGRSGGSYVKVGAALLACAAGFVGIALLIRVWNRRERKAPPT